MPVLNVAPARNAPVAGVGMLPPQEPKSTWAPTFGEEFSAATDQGLIGTLGRRLGDAVDLIPHQADPVPQGFDPFTQIQGYEKSANQFVGVNSPAELDIVKRRIDRENMNRETLAAGGLGGVVAQLGAGLLDPVNLIGGEAALGAKGLGLLGSVARGALFAGGAVATEEATLDQLQATRTLSENTQNVLGAMAFTGVLGGAAHLLEGRSAAELGAKLHTEAADIAAPPTPTIPAVPGGDMASLSAASANRTSFAQEGIAGALGSEHLDLSPLGRTRASPSADVRRISGDLAETPYYLKQNDQGIASSVAAETLIKQHQAPLADALGDMDNAFLRYRTGKAEPGGLDKLGVGLSDLASDITRQDGGKLDHGQFREEVAKAMRRGDEHEIPEVAEAAKSLREKVFDPLKEEAIHLGLLPEDVEVSTAQSYLTRLYNVEKIANQRNAFIDRLSEWFDKDQLRTPDEDKLSPGELRAIAEETANTILRSPGNRTLYDMVPNVRGPLKGRTLQVPDEVIEPWLVNDAERIARTYTRTMGADVELTRKFGRADLRDQIDQVVESYNRLKSQTQDGKKQAALAKRMDRDVRDIEGMRDRIRGTYGMPDNPMGLASRTARVVRTINFTRQLGGMTVSALPDVGSIVLKHGMQRILGDGVGPLLSSLKQYKLAANEVMRAGTALDLVLETRAMQLADVWEDFGRYSKFERGVQYLGEKMGGVSLMGMWNASIKQFAGVLTQTRMLKAIEQIGAGKEALVGETRRLAFLGIDSSMAERIAKEFAAHGEKDGGVYHANTDAWKDAEAVRVYRAALVKEVDGTIVTPGQDRPLWLSTELGKVLGQFKSFNFASTSKVLINGLQQRDANALQGLIVMTGLGMLASYLKGQLSGNPQPTTAAKWVEEGVDQSGILGWVMDANNTAEKLTRNHVGINPILSKLTNEPVQESRRYASRSALETLLGPTAGLINDTATVAADATGKNPDGTSQFNATDVHKLRGLLPFQNLFYTRWLMDAGERSFDSSVGLPQKQHSGQTPGGLFVGAQ